MTLLESELAQKILSAYAHAHDVYFENDCNAFHLEGFDGCKRHSVSCKCTFDASARLFLSVPTITKKIFVTITNGDPTVIRRVLATIEDKEVESCVHLGDVFILEDPALTQHQIRGVILLPGPLFNALEHCPATLTVGTVEYQFVAVVFLTNNEYEVWKTNGHDGLIEYFERTEKDLINFGDSGLGIQDEW